MSLSASIDTPEHREWRDYRGISGLLRNRLIPDLAQSGIFTEILPAPESAADRLDVVVTTAQIRRRVFSFIPDNRVVLQVQWTFRETGQRIGEFEIHQQSEYVTTGLSYLVRRSVEEIIRVLKDD